MTIDEAIAHAREVATIQRNNKKLNDTLGVFSPYNNQDCAKCAHEHDQLAEWLEELKQYRETGLSPEDLFSINFNENQLRLVKMLEEYRVIIGSLGECRVAMEKQTAKKVISFEYHNGTINYGCPVCKRKIISKINGEWCGGTFNGYCDRCGQRLDWGDEE